MIEPQTFRPGPGRWGPGVFFVLVFGGWCAVAVGAFRHETYRPGAWAAYAITFGVPVVMLLMSVLFLLGTLARVAVDGEGVRVEGPLGRKAMRWGDVVNTDIQGTSASGMVLTARDGRRLAVSYQGYREGSPRAAIEAGLRGLPSAEVEGHESRLGGRWALSGIMVGLLAFLVAGTLSLPARSREGMLPSLGLLVAILLPLVAYALTTRVTLEGGVVTQASCFGTKRLRLDEVREARVSVVSTKGGPQENLVLTGPTTVRLSAQREGYAALRDAILAGLPSGVRTS